MMTDSVFVKENIFINAIFLDFNFFINILGLALVSFSSNITKIIGNFLKDNH